MNKQVIEGLNGGLSRILCDLGRSQMPDVAIVAAKNRLLHAFGVSLANSRLPAADVAWMAVGQSCGSGFVFGRRHRIAAEDAAFVNGVIGHGSLLEDCGPGGLREGSHPGTFIIPAALAAAEASNANGRTLLAGLIVGYEAVSRIGAAAPPTIVQRRFRPVGIMGAFGAAAATATILGAETEQMAAALAIAANLAGGSTQGIFEGSMEPYFQAGFGARNGLLAARLGVAGAATSKQALEGDFGFFRTYAGDGGDPERLLAPKSQFGIAAVGTKRFAACLQNQETLALIVDGLDAPLTSESIARVVIRRPETGTNGLNSPGVSRHAPFANMLSAQMSARFTAAAALLGLPVDDPTFFSRHFNDRKIVALTERIELEPANDQPVSVTIELAGGERIALASDASRVLFPDDAAIRNDFLRRIQPVLGDATPRLATLIDGLENVPDVRELTDAISGAAGLP